MTTDPAVCIAPQKFGRAMGELAERSVRSRSGGTGKARRSIVASARSVTFILKALPATSGLIDLVTAPPIVESFTYATHFGHTEAELYRPSAQGRHPAVVVSLGVVPKGMEHPQSRRFAQALARAGFAAVLHWSPALRDLRLDPLDIDDLVSAYSRLMEHPNVDPTRSGLLGTCIGGSYALIAAADASIRDRLRFVSAYAPFSSMWTLAVDIASATRTIDGVPKPWLVDPLAWQMFVRSVTYRLDERESGSLRAAFDDRFVWDASKTRVVESSIGPDVGAISMSPGGREVYRLLTARSREAAADALHALPSAVQSLLTAMSPMTCLEGIHAPLITLLHDRGPPDPGQRIPTAVGRSSRARRCPLHRTGVPASRPDEAAASSARR
jgi:hypothetical protein